MASTLNPVFGRGKCGVCRNLVVTLNVKFESQMMTTEHGFSLKSVFKKILLMLRFQKDSLFKIYPKKKLCSDPWINSFFSFDACSFTRCMYFYLTVCKKGVCTSQKSNQKSFFFCLNLVDLFCHFCGEFKRQDKSNTSVEEPLMSILGICQRFK